jgi:uncharacterized protein YecT (DUF1311 family)
LLFNLAWPVYAPAESPNDLEEDITGLIEANRSCGRLSTVEEGSCLVKIRKAAEHELDSITNHIFTTIAEWNDQESTLIRPEEWKQALIQANDSWIEYRNATCHLYWFESIPGSGTGNMVEQCKFNMTIGRIRYVIEYGISNSETTTR